jgi:hypothetical protein
MGLVVSMLYLIFGVSKAALILWSAVALVLLNSAELGRAMRKRGSTGIEVSCHGGSKIFLFPVGKISGEDSRREVLLSLRSGGPRGLPF